ncbi:MAG: hypothetical protein CMO10_14560 [Thalassospira sp.]|nr:hypothetical protein [Thalassospira sp.]|tara:strand:- start:14305 stop:14604 length:300 start_codon:yes stop_codon:yes gene_type:complete
MVAASATRFKFQRLEALRDVTLPEATFILVQFGMPIFRNRDNCYTFLANFPGRECTVCHFWHLHRDPIVDSAETLCFSCFPDIPVGIMKINLATFCAKK